MGDNIWEKKAIYGMGGDYVRSGRFHNNQKDCDVKKRCPKCGNLNHIFNNICPRCGFNFKNPSSLIKPKKNSKPTSKHSNINKVKVYFVNGFYLITCPYCGWKQDWSNESCVNCDKKFSKSFISGVNNTMCEF